jgi:hypothetical protein
LQPQAGAPFAELPRAPVDLEHTKPEDTCGEAHVARY